MDDNAPLRSFTWFLLPFAYRLQKTKGPDEGDTVWKPLSFDCGDEVWRGTYLMPETNLVLFRRARWFQTRPPVEKLQLKLPKNQGEICVAWEQTRLVLFEYPENQTAKNTDWETLRNGILAIKLSLPAEADFGFILWLNEAFRYYKIPYWDHVTDLPRHEVLQGLPGPGEEQDAAGSYHEMWAGLLTRTLKDEHGTWRLFPAEWGKNARHQALRGQPKNQSSLEDYLRHVVPERGGSREWPPTWDIYPDNRAFVWTCALRLTRQGKESGQALESLPDFSAERLEPSLQKNELLRDWFALLDVDREPQDLDHFSYQWLRERSYTRWATKGTLYGFNNFSVAMMVVSESPWGPAISHFESMYLDMGLLLLYVRTTLFRFSRRIADVTQGARDKLSWSKEFELLREEFSAFTNLYQFPLLSTQQQGIEMYTLMRKHLDVDDIFKEVQAEIAATHEYAELVNQARISLQMRWLTILGVGFATAATVTSLFGMNEVLGDGLGLKTFWSQTGWAVGLGIFSVIITWLLIRFGSSCRLGLIRQTRRLVNKFKGGVR
jgi:hypothetical protein